MLNEFENSLKKKEQKVMTEAIVGRQSQEIQGMIFMAKRFPRDPYEAWQKIKEACSRKGLAEEAQYEYPRGKEKIKGPSIRLAEVIAQNWGNMTFSVIELEQKDGESVAMAYAWDLETNVRSEKIFVVKHERDLKTGSKKLTSSRDIYEMVANQGARRLRACILSVIPKDIVDQAEFHCEETLKSGQKEPISDRIRVMLDKFKTEHGIEKHLIEKYVGCKVSAFTEKDIIKLRRVYTSLKDGMAKREDFFNFEPESETKETVDIKPEHIEKTEVEEGPEF